MLVRKVDLLDSWSRVCFSYLGDDSPLPLTKVSIVSLLKHWRQGDGACSFRRDHLDEDLGGI